MFEYFKVKNEERKNMSKEAKQVIASSFFPRLLTSFSFLFFFFILTCSCLMVKNKAPRNLNAFCFYLIRPAYPSIFDRIRTEIGWQYGCMPVFRKIQTKSTEIAMWINASSLLEKSVGSYNYRLLTFAYGVRITWSHFRGWTIWSVLTNQNIFFNERLLSIHTFCIQDKW